jgi:hypothetical protein
MALLRVEKYAFTLSGSLLYQDGSMPASSSASTEDANAGVSRDDIQAVGMAEM